MDNASMLDAGTLCLSNVSLVDVVHWSCWSRGNRNTPCKMTRCCSWNFGSMVFINPAVLIEHSNTTTILRQQNKLLLMKSLTIHFILPEAIKDTHFWQFTQFNFKFLILLETLIFSFQFQLPSGAKSRESIVRSKLPLTNLLSMQPCRLLDLKNRMRTTFVIDVLTKSDVQVR